MERTRQYKHLKKKKLHLAPCGGVRVRLNFVDLRCFYNKQFTVVLMLGCITIGGILELRLYSNKRSRPYYDHKLL